MCVNYAHLVLLREGRSFLSSAQRGGYECIEAFSGRSDVDRLGSVACGWPSSQLTIGNA